MGNRFVRCFTSCMVLAAVASACSDSSPTSPAQSVTVPPLASVLTAGSYSLALRANTVTGGTPPAGHCYTLNGGASTTASVLMVLSPEGSDWVARATDETLVVTFRPFWDSNMVSGTMGGKAPFGQTSQSVVVTGSPAGEHGQLTGRVGTDGRLSGEVDGKVSFQSAVGSVTCFSASVWTMIPR